ncbi:hypothetical protein C5O00_12700 [Pukyongia salina]|uniref:Uncharacterized protein n=1 Tax=Pukyongia salina TaxID=2094025 RepID=A0A2S0HZ86_9FLAO|nr:hypothetical protein [Pukyongia salina]AVI51965.1 hypothetical protein C5O00_12700 [Pukyongia salina]
MKPQISKLAIFLAFNFTIVFTTIAQVGIGNSSPDRSSLLEIGTGVDTGGILIPRVTLVAANLSTPVSNPVHSLLVFNTATNLTPAGYINDVRPGFYSWDATKNKWVTQTKETRTAKWKSTNTTEELNDDTVNEVNLFGSEIYNDDPALYVAVPSDLTDDLLITESGRYEIKMTIGIEVIEDDKYEEIVIKTDLKLSRLGVDTYPSVTVYGYINDDNDILRGHIQIFDVIEIEEGSELSVEVVRETDSGEVYIEDVGAAFFSIRKLE